MDTFTHMDILMKMTLLVY